LEAIMAGRMAAQSFSAARFPRHFDHDLSQKTHSCIFDDGLVGGFSILSADIQVRKKTSWVGDEDGTGEDRRIDSQAE